MKFLERENAALDRLLPGLKDALQGLSLKELESADSPGIGLFRKFGGPALLVPEEYKGRGSTAVDALHVQRAIGALSPSLAVATTMHHFSMASLLGLGRSGSGLEWMLIEGIAADSRLMASGFAEGKPGSGILSPSMKAVVTPEGVRVSGVKKPCSLARSMDLLTASVVVEREDGEGEQLAVALIPAGSEGIEVEPFWQSRFLAGAESDQITLTDVLVPPELLVRIDAPEGQVDELQTAGFVWFELLMTGSYLGAASALVQRVLRKEGVPAAERIALVTELEAAAKATEAIAQGLDRDGGLDESALAESLFVRYGVQDALARTVPRAVELLGGMQWMGSDDVGQLAASTHGLSLHPPSRSRMTGPLLQWLAGDRLTIS